MSEVWQMATILKFFDGTEMRPRMQTYGSEKAAEDAQKVISSELAHILNRGVVAVPDPSTGEAVSIPVMAFLGQLGIKNVGHGMYHYEVHGAIVLPGRPSLIIAH